MEDKYKHLKAVFLLGFVVLMLIKFSSQDSHIEFLEKISKGNLKKVDSLEIEKSKLIKKIKKDSLELKKKDSLIVDLNNKKNVLISQIEKFKNETKKQIDAYNNSDIDDRIKLFEGLVSGDNQNK